MSNVLEKKENNVVTITMTVEAAKFDEAMEKSFRKNVKYISVRGFRKGKAPRKLIEKTYGEAIFYDDAVDFVCQDAYTEAIKELAIEPVDTPKLEVKEIGSGKDLVLEVTVTVKPEVELGEYKGIKLQNIEHTVSDADVDAEIKRRQERNSRLVSVEDRAVENGDIANIDFEGFTDGVAFPGGKGENHDLEIGSGSFIPGFEEQIIGKNIGEEFDVNVTFPEEYHAEDLKGKPAVFKVKVNSIQYKELPVLDDEFAKDVSEFDTLDELKADIKAKMEEEAAKRTKQDKENAAIEKVVDDMKVDLPQCMIDTRIDSIVAENNMRMSQQGITFEQYLSYMGSTIDQFKEQMKPMAERQVKATLALEAIAKAENIEVTDADVDKNLEDMAKAYSMELDKLKGLLRDEDLENIKADLKISKASEFVVENATWTKTKAAAKKTTKAADKEETAEKKTTAKKTTTKSAATKSTATKTTAAKKTTATKKTTTTKAKKETAAEEK